MVPNAVVNGKITVSTDRPHTTAREVRDRTAHETACQGHQKIQDDSKLQRIPYKVITTSPRTLSFYDSIFVLIYPTWWVRPDVLQIGVPNPPSYQEHNYTIPTRGQEGLFWMWSIQSTNIS